MTSPLARLLVLTACLLNSCKGEVDKAGPNLPPTEPVPATPIKLTKFDLLIDWQAEPTYLGIYYAIDIGAYAKLGLDVTVIQSWGANQAVAAVGAGKYPIATASGGATVLARGTGVDIVSLAVLYPRIPTVIYGLASTGVRSPNDLLGKKIGIYPGSITKNEFDAFVRVNKLDAGKLSIVSITGNDIPLLLSKQVDAVLHYTEMSPVLVETNPEMKRVEGRATFELTLADHGVEGYGLNIVASRAAYKKKPQFYKDLASAMVDGYRQGCKDPKGATAAFMKRFPEKSAEYVQESWKRVCGLVGADPGSQTSAGWDRTIAMYSTLGLLPKSVSSAEILP